MIREPRLVEWGTKETAEHGLGVGVSIGRHARVRPLLRFEAEKPPLCKGRWHGIAVTEGLSFSANQGGTATLCSPLLCKSGFFIGENSQFSIS